MLPFCLLLLLLGLRCTMPSLPLLRSCSPWPLRRLPLFQTCLLLALPLGQSQLLLCPLTCLLSDSAFHEAVGPVSDLAFLSFLPFMALPSLPNPASPQPQSRTEASVFPRVLLEVFSPHLLIGTLALFHSFAPCFFDRSPFHFSLKTCFHPPLCSNFSPFWPFLHLPLYLTKPAITPL